MSSTSRQHFYPLICLLGLASCGGGGGGGGNDPPVYPPADTTPPDTTLSSTPPARSNQRRGNFGVTSNETGVVFEVSLNGGPYVQGQAAPILTLELIQDGEFTVNVRARDAAGNVDPTPATFLWTIDTQAPETTVATNTSVWWTSAAATFTLSSSETGATFEASLDGGAYATVVSPWSLTGLADGAHSVFVRAIDTFANADTSPATFLWTIDTQGPDTTIATTTSARSRSAEATFTLSASEAGSAFEASVDGGAFAIVFSPWSLAGLADGAHSVSVRAIDGLANADATPATFAWQIDTTLPTARVVFPPPVSYTDATQLHIRGTAQDANGVASVSVNGVAAVSTDGFASWSAEVPVPIGEHPFVVNAIDSFGNSNASAASVAVANRGVVVNDIMNLAHDAGGGRLIMTDPERRALLASRISDRYVSVISDASRGTGFDLQQPSGLALDGARALVTDTSSDSLIAIDLATGNRTQLSAPAAQNDMRVASAIAYHAPTQRAFVSTLSGTVLAIDLANGGTRTVFSGGGAGIGPAIVDIRGLAIDPSPGTTRLLAADSGAHAIIAIDLTTGDRSTVSYAAPLDLANQVGSGPAVYGLGQLAVDATAQRVLVPDQSANAFGGRLISIDLATGNRTVLATTTADAQLRIPSSLALDPAAAQVYIGMSERARVFRYEVATSEISPFVDSNVGAGYVLSRPSGLLLDSEAGVTGLYSATNYPIPTIYRMVISYSTRYAVSNYLGTGGAPTFGSPGNFVRDTRAGMAGKALFLDTPLNNPVMTLNSVDLVSGALSVAASAPFPDYRFMSRAAFDLDNHRVIVGLTNPAGGAGSIVAMDIVSGSLTTLASLSVGNGPPMYEIGAVASVPGTFGTTARVLVGTDNSLLAVNGQGDRNFIASGANIGSGPALINISDMMVDFPLNRALVVGATSQAMQWVDLTSGNRTMASGRNPDDQSLRGGGPPLFGRPMRLETDLGANIAYVTAMQTIILAVDLESGDRVIMSR